MSCMLGCAAGVNLWPCLCEAHKLKPEIYKLVYNLLRCPDQMKQILNEMYSAYRHCNAGRFALQLWFVLLSLRTAPAALTLENLNGDFYVPGTCLGKGEKGRWPEILAAFLQ